MKNLTINVGDYVRTETGQIGKITYFEGDMVRVDCDKFITYKSNHNEITKVSPNIIDLIEVGDYVNGEEVNFADVIETWGNEKYCWTETGSISSGQIYSIVTKEQFESMEYKIER